jgi:hypothetical protein
MGIASATLGDVELLNATEVGWAFTPGVQPFQRQFFVHRDDLQTLLDKRKDPLGVELVVTGDTPDESWFVHRLHVLRSCATQHPDMACITVADDRWDVALPVDPAPLQHPPQDGREAPDRGRPGVGGGPVLGG